MRTRVQNRLWRHHLPLFFCSGAAILFLYFTRPYRDPISRASFATAYPAAVLLFTTLLFGPWNLMRKQRNPVSTDLRRDFGIWAGIVGLLHSVIGQCVHLRGRPWLYYVYEHRWQHVVPLRHDLFGFANFSGLAAALVIAALLVTSNDYSIRRLGTPRWKLVQRWSYAACALALIHTFAYLMSEKKSAVWITGAALAGAITLCFQLRGIQIKTRNTV